MSVNIIYVRDAKERLHKFIKDLQNTSVQFVLFAKEGGKLKPYLWDTFHSWMIAGHELLVLPGIQQGWAYMYPKENVVYYMTRYKDYLGVSPTPTPGSTMAHIGEHLTVGLYRFQRDQCLFKCHETLYREIEPNEFDRSENTCDMVIAPGAVITPHTMCSIKNVPPSATRTMHTTIGHMPGYVAGVQAVSRVYAGVPLEGGGGVRREYTTYRGRRYVIHRGPRGGAYIRVGTQQKYIQKMRGGSPVQYKTITFSQELIAFLDKYVVQPVYRARPTLETVRMIFDQAGELGSAGKRYILILYDFTEGTMNAYYVDARTAMMACYAEREPEKANKKEVSCLQQFQAARPLEQSIMVVA